MTYKKGDRVIWDSGFGYDIGFWEEEVAHEYIEGHYIIELRTGNCSRLIVPDYQVHPYSDELVEHLTEQYGYKKAFSKLF